GKSSHHALGILNQRLVGDHECPVGLLAFERCDLVRAPLPESDRFVQLAVAVVEAARRGVPGAWIAKHSDDSAVGIVTKEAPAAVSPGRAWRERRHPALPLPAQALV